MKDILHPLAMIPGVRLASLISLDGVPITSTRGVHTTETDGLPLDKDEELNAFTALASGWLADLTRAVAKMTWDPPRRAVLRATRSEIVMLRAPAAIVLVVLERGVSAEELRVPMEGALARMERFLRGISGDPETPDAVQPIDQPPGLIGGNTVPDSSGAGSDSLASNLSDTPADHP